MKKLLGISCILLLFPFAVHAAVDSDGDGLSDQEELAVYHTNPYNSDTDNDGFSDKIEIQHSYSPTSTLPIKMDKEIRVDLATQTLSYYFGGIKVGEFLISSGIKRLPTPKGKFTVLEKRPIVNYKGPGYWYPNTKWNLMFKRGKKGNYYIHGAYWHNKFGKPMSHGCVNVSYANMESFYDWAEAGTRVIIE